MSLQPSRLRGLTRVVPSRSLRVRVGSSTKPQTEDRLEPKKQKHSELSEPAKYRSKHFDASNSKETSPTGKILLEPHILSSRLKKVCDGGQVDTAVAMLKNSPLDAQNVPVWNTLIWECLKAERFRLAYDLYIDVRFLPRTCYSI
jgi:hypothetical protein